MSTGTGTGGRDGFGDWGLGIEDWRRFVGVCWRGGGWWVAEVLM